MNIIVQVTASTDDCYCENGSTPIWSITTAGFDAGILSVSRGNAGSAARFLNVTIPPSSIITLAKLIVVARFTDSTTTVNSRIHAEANINPLTFTTVDNFNARTRTTAYMDWDNISSWTLDNQYESPTNDGTRYFKDIIQEVIGLSGWASGNPMVIFWDDFDNRSTGGTYRYRDAYSWNGSTSGAPKLYIEYSPMVGNRTIKTIPKRFH